MMCFMQYFEEQEYSKKKDTINPKTLLKTNVANHYLFYSTKISESHNGTFFT
jgi:hypothetical protein